MTGPSSLPPESHVEESWLRAEPTRINGWAWRAGLLAVWLWTWRHLAVEWRLNEQYQFGFAIPFLAAYLAWQRLQLISPAAIRPGAGQGAGFCGVVAAGWALFLFGELVREQDPTWRLAGGLMTFAATILTVAWCWHWGGAVVLRQMAIPLLFAWLALPWPSALENGVTLALMRVVTGLTVSLLNSSGVAAMQHGNTIELKNGIVGVDTACSGVQSFQASLVVALFLGEFYRFSRGKRVALVLGGWVIALLGNLIRVYVLTRLVYAEGAGAVEKYHDGVGLGITIGTFVGIFAASWLLARKTVSPQAGSDRPDWLKVTAFPGKDGIIFLTGVVMLPLVTWLWFAFVPGEGLVTQSQPLWQVASSGYPADWRVKEDPFSAEERNILRFSEGIALELSGPSGSHAQITHMFWKPEASVPSMAFSHTPDICLPSAGWQAVGQSEPVELKVHGWPLAGALFRFRFEGAEYVAFHALWYGGKPENLNGHLAGLGSRGGRLTRLWTGPRRQGHEVLTVFVPLAPDRETQLRALEEMLETVILRNPDADPVQTGAL